MTGMEERSLARTQREALLSDAVAGLSANPKRLPCKWLYDAKGAELFEAITRLPEYYPTRTETTILKACAGEIAREVGPGAVILELGSGAAEKVAILLDALRDVAAYIPVDIAPEWLGAVVARLAAERPGLDVVPVAADFTGPFSLPPLPAGALLGFFPGSTIGNFAPAEAVRVLRRIATTLGPGAFLVLGADLVKDPRILDAAYDDASGVTAQFNLNILARLNRELDAGFDLSAFAHRAVWNTERECMELYLVARRRTGAVLGGRRIEFAEGEAIHTEDSHKYRPERLNALCAEAGWKTVRYWMDPERLFSVWLLRATPGR